MVRADAAVIAVWAATAATRKRMAWGTVDGAGAEWHQTTSSGGSKTRAEEGLEETAAALGPCEVLGKFVKLIASHRSFLS
jgi:hypothetical protein